MGHRARLISTTVLSPWAANAHTADTAVLAEGHKGEGAEEGAVKVQQATTHLHW
jgi:hypothetical protein